MGIFNFLLPTPASHARGTCKAMSRSFQVALIEAGKRGEKDLRYGEIAKRALTSRPFWKLQSGSTFIYSRSNEVITIDVQHDSLKDVISKVVEVEIKDFLVSKENLSVEDINLAVMQALQEVDKEFPSDKK